VITVRQATQKALQKQKTLTKSPVKKPGLNADNILLPGLTEAPFLKALRESKYKGIDNTRPLLPPMPWNMIRNATAEDLNAIFTYLKSTNPVSNRVPAPMAPDQLAKLN